MKPSRLSRRTRIKRRNWLRAKGGHAFPRRRDEDFMAWARERLAMGVRCDCGCGRRADDPAHLIPRSRGGHDKGNVAFLARVCHVAQEKRTEAFNAERGCDLWAKARDHVRHYDAERFEHIARGF